MRVNFRQLRVYIMFSLVLVFTVGIADVAFARVFFCGSGDVFCLIASIRSANERRGADTIVLEGGTYTLTAVDNQLDSNPSLGNGLPSITGRVTITGTGATDTMIEAAGTFTEFRIFHVGSTGHLTLHGVTIRNGFADEGGAIFNRGTLTVSRSEIRDNFANLRGGGIANHGNLIVSQSVIRDNFALVDAGGAIYSVATTTILDSRITSNLVPGCCGGISSHGFLRVVRTTIDANDSNFCTGIFASGITAIEESSITSNFEGGACVSGRTTIVNTTIANNVATASAGLTVGDGATRLINVTVADNHAFPGGTGLGGGGITTSGTGSVQLRNTILARNAVFDSPGLGPDCLGSITSLGNNIIGSTADCTVDLLPTDFVGDAGLGTFVDNGTPGNGHIPLLADSPAIDAANRDACPRTDQLGQRRIDGNGDGRKVCDIGAVEFIP